MKVFSLTIVFLGWHFLFTVSDTFAVECIVQPQQHTAKNRTAGIAVDSVSRDRDHGMFTCDGWLVTLCDPTRQGYRCHPVHSSEMEFH